MHLAECRVLAGDDSRTVPAAAFKTLTDLRKELVAEGSGALYDGRIDRLIERLEAQLARPGRNDASRVTQAATRAGIG
ncbi:hypothetical protein OCGS_2517 [Oceaniovalibus guishaninsula JLT2003]|uniref:Uncharacterized protein n=1 Tax=Oceaniovalibus guishaninsula JLT2003 TaxID=1231392 RepID=K2I3B1_9RHOB|nr:hypothetical protein OCGS_2517 [Oceaniovalibus guishaninsula JLT2003]